MPRDYAVGCRNALSSDFGLDGLAWEVLGVNGRIRGGLGGLAFSGRNLPWE